MSDVEVHDEESTENNFGFDDLGSTIRDLINKDKDGDRDISNDPRIRQLVVDGIISEADLDTVKEVIGKVLKEKIGKFLGFGVPSGKYDVIKPKKLIWRAIQIEMDSDGLKVGFSYQSKGGVKAPKNLLQLELKLQEFQTYKGGEHRELKNADQNWVPEMAGSNALAINVEGSAVVALTLPENSAFQFNRHGAPISCSHKSIADFGEVGRLTAGNDLIVDTEIKSLDSDSNCRTAFFLVKNGGATPIAFNIHLDLVGKHKKEGKSFIPVIFDPVVRHPGGHE